MGQLHDGCLAMRTVYTFPVVPASSNSSSGHSSVSRRVRFKTKNLCVVALNQILSNALGACFLKGRSLFSSPGSAFVFTLFVLGETAGASAFVPPAVLWCDCFLLLVVATSAVRSMGLPRLPPGILPPSQRQDLLDYAVVRNILWRLHLQRFLPCAMSESTGCVGRCVA